MQVSSPRLLQTSPEVDLRVLGHVAGATPNVDAVDPDSSTLRALGALHGEVGHWFVVSHDDEVKVSIRIPASFIRLRPFSKSLRHRSGADSTEGQMTLVTPAWMTLVAHLTQGAKVT